MKNILISCEFSGLVREEFKKKGWNAWSCDLLETEIDGQHYLGDVTDLLKLNWDMMIFHAPCTYLANSGVRWLYNDDGSKNMDGWKNLEEGAEFFKMHLNYDHIPLIAGENPIPHKYAIKKIGRKYDQIIQPYQFGHGETKATCLWLKGLPPLLPTNEVEGRMQKVHLMAPGPERWKNRSRTYTGIAKAMAEQWSKLVEKENGECKKVQS